MSKYPGPLRKDGDKYDVPWNYAKKVLRNNPIRRGKFHGSDVFEIYFKGVWRHIYNTTLIDDVGTVLELHHLSQEQRDDPRKISEKDYCYGARIGPDGFGLITSISDG